MQDCAEKSAKRSTSAHATTMKSSISNAPLPVAALVARGAVVGGRAPLHLTSLGKLFLAADGPQKFRDYAKRTGLLAKHRAHLHD